MTTTLPTTSEQLSVALKAQIATAHTNAENSRFMANLGKGNLDRDAVAELTLRYFHIYSALEAAVRRAAKHPAVALIFDPRLERVDALTEDLTALTGAAWRNEAPLAATQRYVSELEQLGPEDGPEVVAHHYVRYLGDIAGGQVLARVFRNEYGVSEDALHFYDFSTVGKIPPYRAKYKAALDNMNLTGNEQTRLIDTAEHVFVLNQAVFTDLAALRGLN